MATFKLGAIITDIQGSIAGTTIRRTPNGHIMYNKQGTQIKSAFASASQKNNLGNIFRQWCELDKNTKDKWAENALLYPVKDKYGGGKFLTGRQLFTKLNAQLLVMGETSDENDFNTFVEQPPINVVSFNKSNREILINWGGSFSSQYLLISVYRVRKSKGVKPHAHFKRTFAKSVNSSADVDMWTEFTTQFPLAKVGEVYGFNVQFMNSSGILSPVQSFAMELS